jgi:hypothetical protein
MKERDACCDARCISLIEGKASCHVEHTGTHLSTILKLCWAGIELGWVTAPMTSMPGAVSRCVPASCGPERRRRRHREGLFHLSAWNIAECLNFFFTLMVLKGQLSTLRKRNETPGPLARKDRAHY